jgi:hypothetical protein
MQQASMLDLLTNARAIQTKGQMTATRSRTDSPVSRLVFGEHGKNHSGGTAYEVRVRLNESGSYIKEEFYGDTPTARRNVMGKISIPWAYWQVAPSYDEKELQENRGGESIVDTLDTIFDDAYTEDEERTEGMMVGTPASSTDTNSIWGLPVWFPTLPLNTSDTTGGFNAYRWYYQDGTSTDSLGSLDCSDVRYERLRRWAGTYTEINQAFFDLFRRARTRTNFRSIANVKGEMAEGMNTCFAGHATCDSIEARGNQGPDDQQGDAGGKFTVARCQGIVVLRAPVIDSLAYSPVWGVKLGPRGLFGSKQAGRWKREYPFMNDPDRNSVYIAPIKSGGNTVCRDVRGGGFCLHVTRTAA